MERGRIRVVTKPRIELRKANLNRECVIEGYSYNHSPHEDFTVIVYCVAKLNYRLHSDTDRTMCYKMYAELERDIRI